MFKIKAQHIRYYNWTNAHPPLHIILYIIPISGQIINAGGF